MAETELVLSAISGAKLMDLEFMPQEFVVRGLLPKGLSILGGAPKIGKSWLMLELALRVAKGEPMWGMETKEGTVLYYCLENTLQRIQQRLYCITENAPDNLLFEIAIFFFTCNLKTFAIIFIKKVWFFYLLEMSITKSSPNLPQGLFVGLENAANS